MEQITEPELARRLAGLETELAVVREESARWKERCSFLEAAQIAGRQGAWEWDVRKDCFRASESYFRILGREPLDGWLPLSLFLSWVHPDDLPRLAPLPTKAFEVEFRLLRADGAYRWIRSYGEPIRLDEGGVPLLVLGVHTDIHELKETAEKGRRLQRVLQIAVDAMPQRAFWKNLEGRYLGCNQSFALDAGCRSPDQVIGKTDRELDGSVQLAGYSEIDAEVCRSGVPRLNMEIPLRCEHGATRWLRTSKFPLRDDHGEIIGLMGTYEDVTQEKQANEELRLARDAAEAANRAKGQFLANVSHEIRTPMNGILGMISLALETELTDEQYECLENVRISAESLLRIINDILDFSKIEAGRLDLCPAPFALRPFLKRRLALLETKAKQKNLEFTSTVEPGCPELIVADEVRLGQVLVNLIANAVKFTPSHGKVELIVGHRPAGADAVELMFTVRDTGIGIPADKMEAIFSAFTQADNSTTRTYGGTGLGLAIAKHLVELMGGSIQVRSEWGSGAEFTCTVQAGLVRKPKPHSLSTAVHPTPADSGPAAPGLEVLLVEDNPINQRVAQWMLEREGCHVTVTGNGTEAIDALERAKGLFDLVLMDCQMPVLNGLDATRMIREHQNPEVAGVPIVAMTASTMEGDRDRCFAAGMNGYIAKPVSREGLRELLRSARGGSLSVPHPPGRRLS